MSKEHWRYTAYMIKAKVELKKHRCFIEDGVVFERILEGALKGRTSPISGVYRTTAEAVKRLKRQLVGRRSSVLGELARLERQIPACERYLHERGE